jgi:hypothetical protein
MSIQEDNKGHKSHIKLLIRAKIPMSQAGFNMFGQKQKIHINKSRYTFTDWMSIGSKPGSKTKVLAEQYPDGIPVEYLATDDLLANWLMDNLTLRIGVPILVQGFSHGKTKTGIKFGKTLARIIINDYEKRSYKVYRTGILSRYWIRRKSNK